MKSGQLRIGATLNYEGRHMTHEGNAHVVKILRKEVPDSKLDKTWLCMKWGFDDCWVTDGNSYDSYESAESHAQSELKNSEIKATAVVLVALPEIE